jgi:hypothetical protein
LDSNQFPYATAGSTVAFQIRAWSASGGSTYEQAYQGVLNGTNPNTILGTSQMGYVTLGGGIALPAALFGTNPGQISAFTLLDYSPSPSPEPTTWWLALSGGVLLLGWRWLRVQPPQKG